VCADHCSIPWLVCISSGQHSHATAPCSKCSLRSFLDRVPSKSPQTKEKCDCLPGALDAIAGDCRCSSIVQARRHKRPTYCICNPGANAGPPRRSSPRTLDANMSVFRYLKAESAELHPTRLRHLSNLAEGLDSTICAIRQTQRVLPRSVLRFDPDDLLRTALHPSCVHCSRVVPRIVPSSFSMVDPRQILEKATPTCFHPP
jgi:hypothetical protein